MKSMICQAFCGITSLSLFSRLACASLGLQFSYRSLPILASPRLSPNQEPYPACSFAHSPPGPSSSRNFPEHLFRPFNLGRSLHLSPLTSRGPSSPAPLGPHPSRSGVLPPLVIAYSFSNVLVSHIWAYRGGPRLDQKDRPHVCLNCTTHGRVAETTARRRPHTQQTLL